MNKEQRGENQHRTWSIVSKADDRSKRMNIDLRGLYPGDLWEVSLCN